jgi:hypothetical protein
MSRSVRKVPIVGHTVAKTDKPCKVMASKATRSANRSELRKLETSAGDDVDVVFTRPQDITTLDHFEKDGRQYVGKDMNSESYIPKLIALVKEEFEYHTHVQMSFPAHRCDTRVTKAIALLHLPDVLPETLAKVSDAELLRVAEIVYNMEMYGK